jgi:hypothetical protein
MGVMQLSFLLSLYTKKVQRKFYLCHLKKIEVLPRSVTGRPQ